MPFFDYECQACGHRFEALQKVGEGALRKCPACGKLKLQKQVSAPNFHLKGKGWYKTDFRDKAAGGKDGGDGAKAGHSMDSAKEHTHGPGCGHDHGSSSGGHTHSHGGSTHSHGPGGHSHKH
jgi:putative FmdB family regulatory protein